MCFVGSGFVLRSYAKGFLSKKILKNNEITYKELRYSLNYLQGFIKIF